ncbi:hypothetical protein ACIBFB_14105 [Nocardiopsis sp. NPDC050513]|uniref:hypothetical protein n=1 Tax=Nocardiopsis sp. NPDC050513 TaxID=3364338 RepID=UPI00379027FE
MTDRSSRPDDPPPSFEPPPGMAWSLVLGLGSLALLRPLVVVTGLMDALSWGPFLQVALAAVITLVWVLAVVAARAPRPLLTLVCAGALYGAFSIVLSAVLSPVLGGALRGPLTDPVAFAGVLVVNTLWGGFAGLLALGADRVLRRRGE